MLKAWTEVLLIRSIYFYPGLYVKFSWKKQERTRHLLCKKTL